MFKGETLFITGGAGFIGANLIKRLVADNEIHVYDNLSRNALHLLELKGHPNLKMIKGDVLDFQNLKAAIPVKTTMVLHMAAIAGINTVTKSPIRTLEVNMFGTYNVLRALEEKSLIPNIKRFVDFSTSEVYGVEAFNASERSPSTVRINGEPRWSYAVSKLASEYLAHSYALQHGLCIAIVRPFNVYGPGQIGEGAIRNLILRCLRGEPLEIQGEGNQVRSWCFVDDMVKATILVLTCGNAQGESFNIGNPRATLTIRSLAEKIIQLTGSVSSITHVPRVPDVELRVPDISKARELLRYEPEVDIDEGLRRTIEWYDTQLSRGKE